MKQELGMEKPDCLIEDWPGKYTGFSWLEYVVSVPNPMFLVTTLKESGKANANLQSWGLLLGEKDEFWSLVAIKKHQHTFANIQREKEWVINYPTFKMYPQCFETIYSNAMDLDEIEAAGFTKEESSTIRTPRIAECIVNLECKLQWEKPLFEGSDWQLFAGKVTHVAMDEEAMIPDPIERMKEMKLMYNVRSTVNPLNGAFYGPNSIGLMDEVVKIFTDEGQPKEWREGNI